MLPVLPSPFPQCISNDVPPPRIKPRRLRRVRTQQLRRNAEHPRGPTLNYFSPLCSSGALRASSDKNALAGSTVAKMFFRASIALPEAFHRLKRQELSEVTQLFPAESAFSCAGCGPHMDMPPRSDKTASCPLNVPPPRSRRFSPFSHDLESSPQQRTRHTTPLPHPGFRGRGTPAPLLSSALIFSCLSPAVVRPSRSSLQT